jgi:hypothetical protein
MIYGGCQMAILFNVTTTHDFCKSLKKYFSNLHMLPYNYHQPNNTVWWLSPSSEKPAYRFPKFAILPPEDDASDQLFIGLYIEKGVNEDYAKTVGIAKTHIIGTNWAWHTLLTEMSINGKLVRSIDEVRRNTGSNMELRLYANMQIKDAVDALAPKGEKLVFELNEKIIVRPARVPSKLLASLDTCTSLPELSASLKQIPNAGYLWIDLVIGVSLSMREGCCVWGVEDIAKKILAPFEWMVEKSVD